MATRSFCDRCDKQITHGESAFVRYEEINSGKRAAAELCVDCAAPIRDVIGPRAFGQHRHGGMDA